MRKQRGFTSLNLDALIFAGLAAGALVGITVWELLQFVWPYAKTFIHQITG